MEKSRHRKSPNQPAKLYKVGHESIGKDGNVWKIVMIKRKGNVRYKRWKIIKRNRKNIVQMSYKEIIKLKNNNVIGKMIVTILKRILSQYRFDYCNYIDSPSDIATVRGEIENSIGSELNSKGSELNFNVGSELNFNVGSELNFNVGSELNFNVVKFKGYILVDGFVSPGDKSFGYGLLYDNKYRTTVFIFENDDNNMRSLSKDYDSFIEEYVNFTNEKFTDEKHQTINYYDRVFHKCKRKVPNEPSKKPIPKKKKTIPKNPPPRRTTRSHSE